MDLHIIYHHHHWAMEKESLTTKKRLRLLLKKTIWAILLALPILSIIHFDGKILAEIELGDPVDLYNDAPLPMSVVHWSLITALIFSCTPFKGVCSLATGIALGGFLFYGLDQYEQLKDLSEMGLSSLPLMEMVTLTSDGKWLITSIIICIISQCVYGLVTPVLQIIRQKNR